MTNYSEKIAIFPTPPKNMQLMFGPSGDDDDNDEAGTMREVFQVAGMGQLCKLHCVCVSQLSASH